MEFIFIFIFIFYFLNSKTSRHAPGGISRVLSGVA